MDREQEKIEQLRAMKYKDPRPGRRPALNTEGLYVNEIYFDEQFVNALIAGDLFDKVKRRKQLWLNTL